MRRVRRWGSAGANILSLLIRNIHADNQREENLIRASNADWLIMRPGYLTDEQGGESDHAITDMAGVRTCSVSRADAADFILNQLESPSLFKQTPLATY